MKKAYQDYKNKDTRIILLINDLFYYKEKIFLFRNTNITKSELFLIMQFYENNFKWFVCQEMPKYMRIFFQKYGFSE